MAEQPSAPMDGASPSGSQVTTPGPPSASKEPQSLFQKSLKVLTDLKELIGILVFFSGGLFWLNNYVATKQQIAELSCLMQAQIDSLGAQTELIVTTSELTDDIRRLEILNALGGNKTDAQRLEAASLSNWA